MSQLQTSANPFALLTDPAAVLAAIAGSERLGRLSSRICRPLDKPILSNTVEDASNEIEADETDEEAPGEAN